MISIIIPTFQRSEFLKRKLYHLKLQNCKYEIIILDTSLGIHLKKNKRLIEKYKNCLNLNYFDLDKKFHFNKKIFFGIKYIKNKYSIISFDDDFLNLEALDDSLNFLEKQRNYVGANGYVLNYIHAPKKNHTLKRIPILGKFDVFDHHNILERNKQYLFSNAVRNQIFNLYRTHVLKKIYKPLENRPWKKYTEILFNIAAISSGKIKLIKKIFEIRTVNYNKEKYQDISVPNFRSTFYQDFDNNDFISLLNSYKTIFKHFIKKDKFVDVDKAYCEIINIYFCHRIKTYYSQELTRLKKGGFKPKEIISFFLRKLKYFNIFKFNVLYLLIRNIKYYSIHEIVRMFKRDPNLKFSHYYLNNFSSESKFYKGVIKANQYFKKID